jgi:S-adenosyl-L-methionine hydrolase (adenosine-forming)
VFITFLSDYGHNDAFVGVCHGVIARIAPEVRVIDLTHDVPRHDVRGAAVVLRRALPFCPAGVHLVVVDPGVGGTRRAVALRVAAEDRILVGPDNGVLWPAAERFGGVVEAVDVARSPHRLEPVSATFHGRDLFAPVAAQLAAGAPLAAAGEPIDPDELETLRLPMPQIEAECVFAHVVSVDGYGNVALDVTHEEGTGAGLRLGASVRVNGTPATYARTFEEVGPGELMLYEDAYRTLALAVNRGSAKDFLDLALDDEVRIEP